MMIYLLYLQAIWKVHINNATRIYNREAVYVIPVQLLLLPVQKSKPISHFRLQSVAPICTAIIQLRYTQWRATYVCIHGIEGYTNTDLQIYYKYLTCPLQFSHTSIFICFHSYILCNIVWYICNAFLLCAFYARFHLHLFGLRFFSVRSFLFLPFCFLFRILHSTSFISINKNELNLSCKESYCARHIYKLIDNRWAFPPHTQKTCQSKVEWRQEKDNLIYEYSEWVCCKHNHEKIDVRKVLKHSHTTRRMRQDQGICVSTCEALVKSFTTNQSYKLYVYECTLLFFIKVFKSIVTYTYVRWLEL